VRPLIAVGMFLAWPLWIVACRIGDRVGKGLRGSASDALVADWTDGDLRARAFATMRTADNLGAALAPWSRQRRPSGGPATIRCWWRRWRCRRWPCCGGARASPIRRLPCEAGAAARLLAEEPGSAPALGDPRHRGARFEDLATAGAGLRHRPAIGDKPTIAWPVWQVCLAWARSHSPRRRPAPALARSPRGCGRRPSCSPAGSPARRCFAGFAVAQGPWLIVVGVGYGLLVGFTEGAEKTWLASIAPKTNARCRSALWR